MCRIAATLCMVVLASATAHAQTPRTPRGKVHRMEIYNGISQNVRLFGTALTPPEASTLRDLERLENETNYARNLVALKDQYVAGERVLDTHRRMVQLDLYGVNVSRSDYLATGYGPVGGYGYFGNYANQPATSTNLAAAYALAGYAYPGLGYGNYGYGNYGYGASRPQAGMTDRTTFSLASGTGYEGPIKDSVSRTLAVQATPEYVASLEREHDRASLRATSSPTLRAALGMPEPSETRREHDRIRTVAGEVDRPIAAVTLTLKGGEKIYGKKMTENGDWVIVEKVNGGRVRVRMSEVTRIEDSPADGVRYAAD